MALLRRYFLSHPVRTRRFLEILPGTVSWFLILFPVWGSFVVPELVATYIIAFTVYFLYKSFSVALFAFLAHLRIEASKKFDWMGDVSVFPDWRKVRHVIIIPTYKEPLATLRRTLAALAAQTFPLTHLHVVLSFEEREGDAARKKATDLTGEFRRMFGSFLTTFHPDVPGEVKGKSSNTAWAARTEVERLLRQKIVLEEYTTITSQDSDAILHPQYFSMLAYKFLDSPRRYERFWQPAIVFYNNIWRIPAPTRALVTVWSVYTMYLLGQRDRLVNFSTYSTSLKLVRSIGYWDADVIPEDYRVFFKAFFATRGRADVDPLWLPVSMDAAESTSYLRTMVNLYEQVKRWAWGTSDDQYIIRHAVITEGIPFFRKVGKIFHVIEDHFLWPVNWFALTIGALIPPLLNPTFSRTVIGKTLPQVSSGILTLSLLAILVVLFIDAKHRPARPSHVSRFRRILQPFELILLPVVGFFFSALPGLDAHTRLMLGKYLEYRVTEKVE